jgi:uncharacterized protein YbjQ (UPF0145 family)
MRLALTLGSLALLAGCATTEPRSADFPPSSTSSASSAGASESKSEAKSDADDEIAEERALMADPSLVAAASKVRVIQNEKLECPSEIMGLVDIHQPVKTQEQALEVLKRKAAKLKADAVIGVEFHHGEPGEEPTHLSGMAVRCNDLLKGREYTVLEKIEIKGKMGKEDDAEAELLSRAGAMHADLVIAIGFEHGEGGSEPTRVWGTAIKFK